MANELQVSYQAICLVTAQDKSFLQSPILLYAFDMTICATITTSLLVLPTRALCYLKEGKLL